MLGGCNRCDHLLSSGSSGSSGVTGEGETHAVARELIADPPANFEIGSAKIEYGTSGSGTTGRSDPMESPPQIGAPGNCGNGRADGDETDVDCGGDCPGCATGQHCLLGTDCAGGLCTAGLCEPPRL